MAPQSAIDRIAALALEEDGARDITSELTVSPALKGFGVIEFRSGGTLAGRQYATAVARDCGCAIEWNVRDGDAVRTGSTIGLLSGELRGILRAERPLLNLLQRASGIAGATRRFVDAVQGTSCRVLHTRKTGPGLRALDIDAVLAGGGHRHRADLAHELMLKDNHWQALGREAKPLTQVLAQAKAEGVRALYVEVESLEQLETACRAGATRLLVDNQSPDTLQAWARLARERSPGIEIEATGGITLKNARAYADAGADFISVGALTHSVKAADIAVEIKF
ncbi:MAG TPA: carboxylating nicotinate-nucleotide diphosphorylase [Gemmatimonadales bacterium]|nr:carboxylating nicotinate-nucleotide diphosphorylase [Gemmatimonadales bacterium]